MKYDFSSLSSDDFEDLSRDLVGSHIGVSFEAFTAGRDGGIDGRHAVGGETTILQAKHYVGSTFSKLKSKMKEERRAINRLDPKRYLLATSVALTPANKDVLAEVIGSALLSTGDIYGADDLNALLRAHPEIEKAHSKLWEQNTSVLEEVLYAVVRKAFNSLKPPSYRLQFLQGFRLKYILLPTIFMLMLLIGWCKYSQPDLCYTFDPRIDLPNVELGSRECLPSHPVYVKWIDLSEYMAVDPKTGRWPNKVPNRSIVVTKVDEDGTVLWGEQDLLREVNGKLYWQRAPAGDLTEIVGDFKEPASGETGLLIRRQDPEQKCISGQPRRLLEVFVPANIQILVKNALSPPGMRFRWVEFSCAEKRPLKLSDDATPFNINVGPIVAAGID